MPQLCKVKSMTPTLSADATDGQIVLLRTLHKDMSHNRMLLRPILQAITYLTTVATAAEISGHADPPRAELECDAVQCSICPEKFECSH